jgi:lipopolysaccharide transport system ATP-binding protein
MSDTVIKVENLSKKYIIRHQQAQQYTALRDVITDGVKSIGRRLSGAKQNPAMGSTQEEFWALKDVSFEVKQGDRIGIIGRNGAGKSTLLKILSRIVEPTEGEITLNGRVASLLEVGTGFHPELTGRENIYLNGAILGMGRLEIGKKFDEIVEFSEVEKFLDTPVKRYSSGMYVRLAFAVAAHLEPEILVVDEVLAVGDGAFQRKCLGKMEDTSTKEGKTILFVSHNIGAIRKLCNRALLIKNSSIAVDSDVENVIGSYISEVDTFNSMISWDLQSSPKSHNVRFVKAYILNDQNKYSSSLDYTKQFSINLEYEVIKDINGLRIGFFMQNSEGIPICGSTDSAIFGTTNFCRKPGFYLSSCIIPGHLLNSGSYSIYFGADMTPYSEHLVQTPYCLTFSIKDTEGHGSRSERLPGILRPKLEWEVSKKN